ncbi:CopD family protein [Salmonella enterica]|uniref:CopD family protein n=1 Tax=Salmonella enterica TaxID=28901 RepID=UPI003D22D6C8
MMLTFVWITLRFIHFASLMLVYGCALYGAWLAPASIRRLMTRRFLHLQRHAAAWFGGLLPVVYCMRMAQGRWRQHAISAMMRFSRYGHFFVAGVLLTGIGNTLFITGFTAIWQTTYGQLLLLKCALVVLMVAIALTNRYVLVPRMRQENPRTDLWFVRMTQIEWGVGGIVLAIVSLFATLEPF